MCYFSWITQIRWHWRPLTTRALGKLTNSLFWDFEESHSTLTFVQLRSQQMVSQMKYGSSMYQHKLINFEGSNPSPIWTLQFQRRCSDYPRCELTLQWKEYKIHWAWSFIVQCSPPSIDHLPSIDDRSKCIHSGNSLDMYSTNTARSVHHSQGIYWKYCFQKYVHNQAMIEDNCKMESLWVTVEHGMERAFVEACFGISIDDGNIKIKCDSPDQIVQVVDANNKDF